ncbi:cell division protein FtsQ/DivIB [Arcanobacterium ihumii]|uniref:cell division protein FtsQ/DivIB n=1 Tax=Arcanobacterium ihumii TaxID=2138162 RepID=UPI000F531719|nr:FtsQ-type POTRA domain-containing protein [Arcanobacterium ihumii]
MRAPRQPRKPRKITPSNLNQSYGGELSQGESFPSADSVETAAFAQTAPIAETAASSSDDWSEEVSSTYVDKDNRKDVGAKFRNESDVTESKVRFAKLKKLTGRVKAQPYFEDEAEYSEYREWRKKISAAAAPLKLDPRKEKVSTQIRRDSAVVSLGDRRAEQKSEIRRGRIKKAIILLGVVAILVFVGWLLFFSPMMKIGVSNTTVNFSGSTNPTSQERVAGVLKNYEGKQLLRINRGELEDTLEEIPEVAHANVSVSPFSGLVIDIDPQIPLVCVMKNGACVPLSVKGEELQIPPEVAQNLPILDEVPQALDKARVLRDIDQVFGDLQADLSSNITKIRVSSGYQFAFTFKDGREVFWGITKDGAAKAKVLRAVLGEQKSKFDVSIPTAPVAQ